MVYKEVRVMDRSDPWYPRVAIITVPWVCPKCGGPRGAICGHNQCEDGEWFHVNVWDNPCGHVDYYSTMLMEAKLNAFR